MEAKHTDNPFSDWIGRSSESEDQITERLVSSFRAIFEPNLAPTSDDEAPLGVHWCLSPAIAPMAALGGDGHPAKSLSLPPVPLPRRMWAGGSVDFLAPLKIGDVVCRTSTIADVVQKIGKSGELWFVTVNHDYLTESGLAIRERQDIVYRDAAGAAAKPAGAAAPAIARPAARSWRVETTPTLLFRYSAVTFNGHRIHYDYPYTTQVEGYPGLVVHGPLQATLLLNLAGSNRSLKEFGYRGIAPAIAGVPLEICSGDGDALWTASNDGVVHMEAKARYT